MKIKGFKKVKRLMVTELEQPYPLAKAPIKVRDKLIRRMITNGY